MRCGEQFGKAVSGDSLLIRAACLHNFFAATRLVEPAHGSFWLPDAGNGNLRWHDLRHKFASRFVMAYVDMDLFRK